MDAEYKQVLINVAIDMETNDIIKWWSSVLGIPKYVLISKILRMAVEEGSEINDKLMGRRKSNAGNII